MSLSFLLGLTVDVCRFQGGEEGRGSRQIGGRINRIGQKRIRTTLINQKWSQNGWAVTDQMKTERKIEIGIESTKITYHSRLYRYSGETNRFWLGNYYLDHWCDMKTFFSSFSSLESALSLDPRTMANGGDQLAERYRTQGGNATGGRWIQGAQREDRWSVDIKVACFFCLRTLRERETRARERGTRSRTHTESENAVDRTRSEIVVIETRMLLAGTNGR